MRATFDMNQNRTHTIIGFDMRRQGFSLLARTQVKGVAKLFKLQGNRGIRGRHTAQ